MSADLKGIGARIREARGKRTLEQFSAEIGGISKSMISKYENGEAWPKPEVLIAIVKAGGVSFDWLFTGNEPWKPQTHAPVTYAIDDDAKAALKICENVMSLHGLDKHFAVTEIHQLPPTSEQLTDEEKRLLLAFRTLGEKARKRKLDDLEELAGFIREETTNEKEQQKKLNNGNHVDCSISMKE